MPIEVRHDVPAGMTAMVAAMAGRATGEEKRLQAQLSRSAAMSQTAARIGASRDMQAQQLDAQADRQHESIQARVEAQQQQIEAASERAHQQAEYAKDQIGLRAGLQEELQEQKFGQEMERMEVAANKQAQQFEWKMDVTAKKLMNEARRGLTFLNTEEARDTFDDQQIEQLRQQYMVQLTNPMKTPTVREPQPDDDLVDDQGNSVKLNQVFTDDSGDRVSFQMGSRGQVVREVHTPYRYSRQYLDAQAEREQENKVREIYQKQREYAGKLMEKPVPVYENGEVTDKERLLTWPEAMQKAGLVHPGPPLPVQSQEQSEAERQQGIDAQKAEDLVREEALANPRELIGWSRALIGKLTEVESKLPGFEGLARAFMREIRRRQKAGQRISPEMTPAIEQALAIMEKAKRNAKD